MAIISSPITFSSGEVITASDHNTNYSNIYTEFNGNIDNANIKALAGIVDSKLAQITTASKVSGAAITSLASLPASAGIIPVANLGAIYPVGSIYLETTGVNPGTTFGFGTWAAFGVGRVIISAGGGYTSGTTGGAATHTLITAEIPGHTHTISGAPYGGNLGLGTNLDTAGGTSTSSSTGGGTAHNNLQPYIVAYMWNRTA
jgi:microcystin-dependent protein